MNFQDEIPLIPIDKLTNHYVIVFDSTSKQDATENCQDATELIVMGERMSSVAVNKVGVVGEVSKMDSASLQQIINRFPQLKYRYRGSFPSDCFPFLKNDTFAIINTPPSETQCELLIMITISCQRF